MSAVHDLCKNKFSNQAKLQLNECLRSCVSYFEEQLEDTCLTKQQAIEEIKKIQANLGEQQAVGYVFTNNRKLPDEHFESIIITRKAIYKPIEWHGVEPDNKLSASDFSDDSFYSVHLQHFWSKSSSPGDMLEQQADTHHCGVIGIAALNRILQNDAVELTRNSLAFSFYTDTIGSKQHLFIPSTIFLQYSQSSKYMSLLSKIVGSNTPNDPLKESQQTNRYPIPTLEQVLLQSIEYAEVIGDQKMLEQNKETLAALPAFKEQWQQGYKVACSKHDVFYDKGKSKQNYFLNFLANKMQDLIVTRNEQRTSNNGFFATLDCNNPLLTKDNDNSIMKINNN